MNSYNHNEIEKKWQKYWKENEIHKTNIDLKKTKFYSLDMFPYPSGSGLHVGHPLGYIASDIYARYKKIKGFNVLHPMGFDTFGLPAEQYAIETGQHPAITTDKNMARYKEQLDMLGLSYDWSREVVTSDPNYYKWTQWIFIKLFKSWYDKDIEKARPIDELIHILEHKGNININAACDENTKTINSIEWQNMNEKDKNLFLLKYRLAYIADTKVNWCSKLGTVLANEEVKDGLSERGGYPVIQKVMKQWSLRITAYADRLLDGLKEVDWSDSIKEIQKNWIGKSMGAEIQLELKSDTLDHKKIKVFTTRPDTIFGVTYIALAPEHSLLDYLFLEDSVRAYLLEARKKSERERSRNIEDKNGIFTGYYAIHPFSKEEIPIWIAEYVLSSYGTGAVMGVPAHDDRDYDFAKKFNISIKKVIKGGDITKEAFVSNEGTIINSEFLNNLSVKEGIKKSIKELENNNIGKGKVNFKLRNSIFSRQRYWGEPIPIYYKGGVPYCLDEKELPLKLPEVKEYKPTPEGDPPLGNASNWNTNEGYPLELSTMPGWAGSSWYFLRYIDNENDSSFVGEKECKYWENVDLYIGGSEHATGHLIYSRFWTKFLKDLGYIDIDEPFKKMINQGMIQGISQFVYRINETNKFVSFNLKSDYETTKLHVDISLVKNGILDTERFKKWREEYRKATFILEDDKYKCGSEVEKMSKSKYNTVSPDDIIDKYGADSFRLYSMFLGPLEHSKPWNTAGIDGTYRFISKLWRLFHSNDGKFYISDEEPNYEELKILHKTLKKINQDIERYSFNTCVSTFMICVNELLATGCSKRLILNDLIICLSPFVPHISEELWQLLGNDQSIFNSIFPEFDEKYIQESSYEYPIAINGKTRLKIKFPIEATSQEIEETILNNSEIQKWFSGQRPKKIIVVPKRIVNIVV